MATFCKGFEMEAQPHLIAVPPVPPEAATVSACLHLARSLLLSKQVPQALLVLEQAIPNFPRDIELLFMRGQCLEAMQNGPAAFSSYMSLLLLSPRHVPTLCAVGIIFKARGMQAEALLAFQQAYDVAPAPEVSMALASLYVDIGSQAKAAGAMQQAEQHYRRALEFCPSHPPAYYNLGVLCSETYQIDQALVYYQQSVLLAPGYAEAHCNMGVIYKDHGDLDTAIACYQRALDASPNFAIVKSNLAIALTDAGTKLKLEGKLEEGIALYERALSQSPKYVDALYNLGVAYGERGQTDRAIFMYETAVQCNPRCAEAHNNLGVIYRERDNVERAVECYTAALLAKPNFSQSLNNMGVIYTCQGRAQEALTLLTTAISACPTYAEAYNNLGVLQRDVGAVPQALDSYNRCLELAPDSRNAGQNRLLALNYMYSGDEPEVCIAHAEWGERFSRLFTPLPPLGPADRDPSLRHRPLRVGYVSPDLFTHSVSYFAEAPLTYHGHAHRAAAARRDSTTNTAMANAHIAPRLAAPIALTTTLPGRALEGGVPGRISPPMATHGVKLARMQAGPGADGSEGTRGVHQVSRVVCDGFDGTDPTPLAITGAPGAASWDGPRPHSGAGLPSASVHPGGAGAHTRYRPRGVQAAQHWVLADKHEIGDRGERCEEGGSGSGDPSGSPERGSGSSSCCGNSSREGSPGQAEATSEGGREAAGVLAAGSQTHRERGNPSFPGREVQASAQPASPVRVQHFVYCCVPKHDAKSLRLRAAVEAAGGVWREATHLNEAELARLVREDEIDILVELTGHTANNRLGTTAMKPAPVQVTWIGYPNTTGLAAVDYRLTDEYCDPWATRQTYVEELVRLRNGCFLCYTPSPDAPPVAPAPCLTAGYITFGSFNNLAKITPEVLALWARILSLVPRSRLLLKNKPFACETAQNHIRGLLMAQGIEPWRVDLLPLAAATQDHLSTYSLMDISLDTFPYAGTTTTCESLIMGVPCLTLAGRGHAHNVGVTLVTAVGLQEDWVASSPQEYVALAVRHAMDLPRLAALRQELRPRMLASRLCDAPGFVAGLEQTYADMWETHVSKVGGSMVAQTHVSKVDGPVVQGVPKVGGQSPPIPEATVGGVKIAPCAAAALGPPSGPTAVASAPAQISTAVHVMARAAVEAASPSTVAVVATRPAAAGVAPGNAGLKPSLAGTEKKALAVEATTGANCPAAAPGARSKVSAQASGIRV